MTTPTEQLLDGRKGVRWRHEPALDLDAIDLVASITNQSRHEPIDGPTVERYIAALQAGATFPPILVREVGSRLVVLGGNHRTRAHLDAGRTTIEAFLVECDDVAALELAYADNATHGLPPTDDERIAHALLLVDRHGRTVAKAAKIVGIDPQRVHRVRAGHSVEKRAADLGLAAELTRVPLTIRPRLGSLHADKVFTAVVKAIVDEGISTTRALSIIGDLNSQPSTKAALELLTVHVDRHRAETAAARKVGRPGEDPYLRLRTALGVVLGLRPVDVAHAAGDSIALADLARLTHEAAGHLVDIHNAARMAGRVAS